MGRIHILPPQVAARIAAGEVITRPAAVVKELVENALDAGARHITVEIEDGGRRLIRVVDDGCGMTPEEAPLALMRHATSKIRSEEDLLAVTTLGFRGEALPSIAQVSRLELTTRPPGTTGGWRVRAEGGEILASHRAAAPEGTQVTVTDLFFNTPVRRKFLKSREAEQAQIVETLRHLALGYPEVHFRLLSGTRILFQAPAAQTLRDRLAAVFGLEAVEHLLPFALEGSPWAVQGVLSLPDYTVASSRFQVLLVNRRVVQDKVLGAAIKTIYQGLLPRGRQPVVVASLALPPEEVDVNVHPAKAEVRFRDPGKVYALLLAGLRQGLGEGTAPSTPRYQTSWEPAALALALDPGSAALPEPWPRMPRPPMAVTPDPAPPPLAPAFRFQDLEILGQLQQSYIVAESPEGLILIDQHAAHERILYEFLAAAPESISRQSLLFPKILEIPPAQVEWVVNNLPLLARFGLELEPFGGAAFRVVSVPAWLAEGEVEALVLDLVGTLAPVKNPGPHQEILEQIRTLMACHGAIKAGRRLEGEEMRELLRQLDAVRVSSYCPHGRPVWRLIPLAEIRAGFRRPRS